MLGLNRRESKVFRFSLVGHGMVAMSLFCFGILPSCEEELEEIHVFELAAASPFPQPAEDVPLPPAPPKSVKSKNLAKLNCCKDPDVEKPL